MKKRTTRMKRKPLQDLCEKEVELGRLLRELRDWAASVATSRQTPRSHAWSLVSLF
jgi:hypothetical protein